MNIVGLVIVALLIIAIVPLALFGLWTQFVRVGMWWNREALRDAEQDAAWKQKIAKDVAASR
jgi:hypothetical protein